MEVYAQKHVNDIARKKSVHWVRQWYTGTHASTVCSAKSNYADHQRETGFRGYDLKTFFLLFSAEHEI